MPEQARRFAELLHRLDQESLEVVHAAISRLKRDHDGSFTRGLEELDRRAFRSEDERERALWSLIVDRHWLPSSHGPQAE